MVSDMEGVRVVGLIRSMEGVDPNAAFATHEQ